MQRRNAMVLGVLGLVLLALADSAGAYYMPRMGRFLNRDPLSEQGFILVRRVDQTAFVPRDPLSPSRAFVDGGAMMKLDPILNGSQSNKSVERARFDKAILRREMELADEALYRAFDNAPTNKIDPLGLICGCQVCRGFFRLWPPDPIGHTWIECDNGETIENPPGYKASHGPWDLVVCKDIRYKGAPPTYPMPPIPRNFVGPPAPMCECDLLRYCMRTAMAAIPFRLICPGGQNCIGSKNTTLSSCGLEQEGLFEDGFFPDDWPPPGGL